MEIQELTKDRFHETKDLFIRMAEYDGHGEWGKAHATLAEDSLKAKLALSYVGVQDGKVICASVGEQKGEVLHIEFYVVDEKYRKNGFGTEMLKYWEDFAKRTGFLLTLTTWSAKNAGRIKYYLDRNYRITGTVENEFGDEDTQIHFVKEY